ncbi:hypothetical protein RUND412_009222 [Rhizina undulata]
MTDLTPTFNALLSTHSSAPTSPRIPPPTTEFLKEAYRIRTHIRTLSAHISSLRAPYLSTSTSSRSLTDPQRDELDRELSALLRECLGFTTRLESTEKIRHATALAVHKRRIASFSSLFVNAEELEAEEDKIETERAWREAVVAALKTGLERVGGAHKEMVEARLKREEEKRKSVLAEAGRDRWVGRDVVLEEIEAGGGEGGVEGLTREQLQLFEKENEGLVKHYEDALTQVRTAEKSLLEISELQTQLANNLAVQNAHIENLVSDSLQTTENMKRGNKELKKAGERFTMARTAFWSAATFAGVVIVWDWFI